MFDRDRVKFNFMKRKSILYFLNFYNDIDHTAPLIASQLREKVNVHVICNSHFEILSDLRFKYLAQSPFFHFHQLSLLPRNPGTSNEKRGPLKLWAKVGRELLFSSIWATFFLRFYGIGCVVFTWGRPRAKGIQKRVFDACMFNRVRTVCIPHGLNIYRNYDVNSALREKWIKTSRWPDFSDRNGFDKYIVQTSRHLDQHVFWGMDCNKLLAAGSLRFLPSWVEFNNSLIDDSRLLGPTATDNYRLVFFIPHWRYNVDYEATISLILRLASIPKLEIFVKGHTRGDAVSDSTIGQQKTSPLLHWNCAEESPALIRRANIVINFGSSVAIEAIVTGVPVIYPKYLHSNQTIFDDSGTVHMADNEDQVVEFLNQLKRGKLPGTSESAVRAFLKSEVFNNLPNEEAVIKLYRKTIG